ncbi:hypothetical protein DRP53_07325 [candidate division WOR-3 bacterium]|uniref:Uncharacterized protein n=1 Tax=candidate division WOR-3 bacterium TaxID=2052148 RepID=A0A660SFX4_UNCW3|nr:MAG: hypothetical protein DRP53_07325 [candidate division WOR-3 bacterium]
MWRLVPLIFLSCSHPEVDRVVKYLRNYRRLKMRITDSRQLEDSLSALNRRYGWDLDSVKNLIRSWEDPRQWEKLMEGLREEK